MTKRRRTYKYLQRDEDFTRDETYITPIVCFTDTSTGEHTYRTFHPFEVKRRILARIRTQYNRLTSKGANVSVSLIQGDDIVATATTWPAVLEMFKKIWKQRT